jgi:tousled-like kinase
MKSQLKSKDDQIKQITSSRDEYKAEVDRLKFFIERIEHDRKPLEDALEKSENKREGCKVALIKYLRILQDKSNMEKKTYIASQSVKLGQLIHKRVGGQFKQVWEDGDELLNLKQLLIETVKEKESLEKIRRSKKTRKIMEQATSSNTTSAENKEIDNLFDISNTLELTQNLFRVDEAEQKEFLTFKISMKQKEEAKLREKLDQLKREKNSLSSEMRRQNEELNSTLCGKKAGEKFPILNSKYMVLSLLGKGGYSEVYRAYDLENCREVACKIHRFDETWSRSMQANYIKHALRENETHQKLNHPRIVKHYDTIELDNNSFCTVLELCTGPDLSVYLKSTGCLPEKDARLIITQILSGLKYLSDHNPKIIHYDLKPQNILFDNGEIKISDFGL